MRGALPLQPLDPTRPILPPIRVAAGLAAFAVASASGPMAVWDGGAALGPLGGLDGSGATGRRARRRCRRCCMSLALALLATVIGLLAVLVGPSDAVAASQACAHHFDTWHAGAQADSCR